MLNLKAWLSQITTGIGASGALGTLIAVYSGQMSWPTAIPLLAAAIAGILWPENAGAKTSVATLAGDAIKLEPAAMTVAADVKQLIDVYNLGKQHGVATASTPAAPPAAPVPAAT